MKFKGCVLVAFLLFGTCACQQARLRETPPYGSTATLAQQSELVPGPAAPPRPTPDIRPDARTLAEGRRLYNWYNCSGCHFAGGGGIGPPLMDDNWIYGSHPANIAATIIEGRPNGMPSYGGRIPAEHLGPIVAHVRNLSGLGSGGATTPTPLPQAAPRTDGREKESGGK